VNGAKPGAADVRAQLYLQRAAAALADPDAPYGSLFLYSLACAYLCAPEDDDAALHSLFQHHAEEEQADGDEVLSYLIEARS
jgi:hypothetical protein